MELFAKPIFLLYLLGALLVAGGMLAIGKKLKNRAIHILFGTQAYQKLISHLRPQSAWQNVLLLASISFLFVALAGPQWGTEITQAQGSFAQTVIA
ncbi:MAG: hypothetical protein IKA93_00980, partial [Elusimicrobiaceae bacterium]|nr:hypothetical protein [Elusimicrobiaceae bacterium]